MIFYVHDTNATHSCPTPSDSTRFLSSLPAKSLRNPAAVALVVAFATNSLRSPVDEPPQPDHGYEPHISLLQPLHAPDTYLAATGSSGITVFQDHYRSFTLDGPAVVYYDPGPQLPDSPWTS